ncbi:UNVERIFIED_CONTAM: hypothetical protein FKN15_000604 [Acipenser sinensis]
MPRATDSNFTAPAHQSVSCGKEEVGVMSGARDRPVAPLSSDPGAARVLNALWKFLERTGLQRFVEGLCVETLRGPQSPRNPYPAFINRAREQAERYRLAESTTAEKFLSDVSFQTSPTAVRYIAGAMGCSHVWGHPSILRAVDPEQIEQFDWLVEDVTPPLASLHHSSPYTIQVLAALSGPCVFTRTLYPTQPPLELLQIYIIAGPDPQRAAELYADCVRSDVIRASQQGRHRLLRSAVKGRKVKEEVTARGGAFMFSVRGALQTRLPVRAQCVWRLDPPGTRFQGGAKLYSLSVIQTAEHSGGERMELWGECDSEILQRALPGTPALSQQDPLFDCGLQSALRAAHPTLLHSALRRAAPLSSITARAGSFKVRMALAIQPPSSWLGTLSPFLCSLQATEFCYITAPPGCLSEVLQAYAKGTLSPFLCSLHATEFCYITAPPGCLSEVLQAYAKIVHSQLGELGKREDLTPFSVHLGRGEVWGQERVLSFPCAFTERVIQDLRAGHALRIEVPSLPKIIIPFCSQPQGSGVQF